MFVAVPMFWSISKTTSTLLHEIQNFLACRCSKPTLQNLTTSQKKCTLEKRWKGVLSLVLHVPGIAVLGRTMEVQSMLDQATQQKFEKKGQSNTMTHVSRTTILLLTYRQTIKCLDVNRALTLRASPSSMWFAVTTLCLRFFGSRLHIASLTVSPPHSKLIAVDAHHCLADVF